MSAVNLIFSPGKQWDQNSRHSGVIPILHGYALSSRLVYMASRASLRGNSAGDPPSLSLHVRLTRKRVVSRMEDGVSQGRKAASAEDGATMER
jgi:hypothetical protein